LSLCFVQTASKVAPYRRGNAAKSQSVLWAATDAVLPTGKEGVAFIPIHWPVSRLFAPWEQTMCQSMVEKFGRGRERIPLILSGALAPIGWMEIVWLRSKNLGEQFIRIRSLLEIGLFLFGYFCLYVYFHANV